MGIFTFEKMHFGKETFYGVSTTENWGPSQSPLPQVGIKHLLGVGGRFRMGRLP